MNTRYSCICNREHLKVDFIAKSWRYCSLQCGMRPLGIRHRNYIIKERMHFSSSKGLIHYAYKCFLW